MPGDRILRIDLDRASQAIEDVPPEVMAQYVGGRGLGAYLLYHYLDTPGIDSLSPDNCLIFSTGPAQGAQVPFSPKTVLTTRSPLTGIYLYTVASGSFGHSLRKAGLAGLAVKGKAPRPTYLFIRGEQVEFRPAVHLWGMKTGEAQKAMLEEVSMPGASCLTIGPAGEEGIPIATIVTEGDHFRTFGRGGSGCVMGAKNLKGIVVWGKEYPGVARKQNLLKLREGAKQRVRDNPNVSQMWMRYGTGGGLLPLNKAGILPTYNWQTGVFSGSESIDATTAPLFEQWPRKTVACGPYCLHPCSHRSYVGSGDYAGSCSEGPEYESLYALGSNCGIDRLDAIIAAEQICDEYGLDTISTGVTIGFAMECYEKGLLNSQDIDGLDLRFGNHEAMVALVKKIATKEGIGRLLGRGVRNASQAIPGSEAFAMHVKGLEMGGYEARGSFGQAIQYALSPVGGSHHALGNAAWVEISDGTGRQMEGKGELLKKQAILSVLYDSAILCSFGRFILGGLDFLGELLTCLTGRTYSPQDLEKAGLRIITLERLFNIREGVTRPDDTLPARLLAEPMPEGPNRGQVVDLEPLKDDAYQVLGWDKDTGIPTPQSLQELGLPMAPAPGRVQALDA